MEILAVAIGSFAVIILLAWFVAPQIIKLVESDKGRHMFYAAIGGALLMLLIFVTSKK